MTKLEEVMKFINRTMRSDYIKNIDELKDGILFWVLSWAPDYKYSDTEETFVVRKFNGPRAVSAFSDLEYPTKLTAFGIEWEGHVETGGFGNKLAVYTPLITE
jgi:hypothetical protein